MTRRIFISFTFAVVSLFAFASRCVLAADESGADSAAKAPLVSPTLFEKNIAYLRISGVEAGLDEAIVSAWATFSSASNLIGVVVDLRYATGGSVETEQAAANLIETNKLPLAILVNGETRGGAVSLAAILRDSHQGLVYGSATQGTKNYGPIQPDITVQVSPEDERAYFADAFRMIQHTNQLATGNVLTNEVGGENQPTQRVRIIGSRDGGMNWKFTGENQPTQRVRITEADLVRQRLKDTGEESLDLPARPSEPQVPLVNDPVLARALDFLKGLAIVREAKF